MITKKKVLVTGATGFIGQATVSALIKADWDVTQGIRTNIQNITGSTAYLDLSQPSSLLQLEKGERYDAIVHLGARIGWTGATESEMFVPNVLSTGCLAYLANLWDAHFIYASAAIVHGAKNEKISIKSEYNLDTAYAKSKFLGEQLLSASNVKRCVLRIVGVFGFNGPEHLGINRAINGAIKGEVPIQISSGTALRNYIYVKDVAQAIVYVLQNKLLGVHLLAGQEVISFSEMLQQVCGTFLPGMQPIIKNGIDAIDQVVSPSDSLPQTLSFHEALIDLKKGYQQ